MKRHTGGKPPHRLTPYVEVLSMQVQRHVNSCFLQWALYIQYDGTNCRYERVCKFDLARYMFDYLLNTYSTFYLAWESIFNGTDAC